MRKKNIERLSEIESAYTPDMDLVHLEGFLMGRCQLTPEKSWIHGMRIIYSCLHEKRSSAQCKKMTPTSFLTEMLGKPTYNVRVTNMVAVWESDVITVTASSRGFTFYFNRDKIEKWVEAWGELFQKITGKTSDWDFKVDDYKNHLSTLQNF